MNSKICELLDIEFPLVAFTHLCICICVCSQGSNTAVHCIIVCCASAVVCQATQGTKKGKAVPSDGCVILWGSILDGRHPGLLDDIQELLQPRCPTKNSDDDEPI